MRKILVVSLKIVGGLLAAVVVLLLALGVLLVFLEGIQHELVVGRALLRLIKLSTQPYDMSRSDIHFFPQQGKHLHAHGQPLHLQHLAVLKIINRHPLQPHIF